ncbi:MAG: heavy metal-responsive transcriptional regulator [Motiliproteus sp.]|nr:heavy metal-responsive transcriptional regulator [Motiliproteus sp.]MCW9053167.1 heavy metal-responsive transcriptional regulator [Motiliproteus sp.]
MKLITIGKLATATGLSTDAIRFYEKQGLITPSSRTESGYRQYDSKALERIKFIAHAKEVGFTLDEIYHLLLLQDDPTGSCAEVKEHGRQKIKEISRKLVLLTQMKESLTELVNKCSGEGPSSECPILDGLNNSDTSI